MVFHWSLSDSKSPLISRTLLCILAVLSNAVIWIVSTHPPNFKSSRPFNNPLVIVPKATFTIGTIVTFTFHSFFNSLARSFHILSVLFCGQLGQQNRQFCNFSFFLLIIIRSGFLVEIRWSVCMSKSHIIIIIIIAVFFVVVLFLGISAGLVRFYFISILVYLMPNHVYTYIY